MIKGYIFDYGGTLDTGGQHWGKVIWHAYERQQVPVSEEQFRESYVHAERTLGKNPIIKPDFTFKRTLEEKIRIELEFLGLSEYQQAVVSDLYVITCEETARSREVLLQLKQSYPMVLVSNFYGNIGVVLKEMEIDGLFKAVVESAVVGVRKPDPRIFLMGAEALGLQAAELVAVGDNYSKDIVPASNSGFRTVWLRGEQWDEQEYDTSLPECVVDTIGALPALFGLAPK